MRPLTRYRGSSPEGRASRQGRRLVVEGRSVLRAAMDVGPYGVADSRRAATRPNGGRKAFRFFLKPLPPGEVAPLGDGEDLFDKPQFTKSEDI